MDCVCCEKKKNLNCSDICQTVLKDIDRKIKNLRLIQIVSQS